MAKVNFTRLKRKLRALSGIGYSKPKPPRLPQPFDGNYAPIIEHLTALIEIELKAGNLTGVSIALIDNHQEIWSEGFGLANKKLKIRASSKTRYRLASVSKLFNAVAVMREVEKGNLDLDAAIVEYIPEFRIHSRFGPTNDITLRNLLTHHSGLPEEFTDGKWGRVRVPLESIVESLSTVHTTSRANTYSAYSNIAVSLSGLALQMQSGKKYEDYMHDFLLQPLQMFDSDFSGQLAGTDAAVGYHGGRVVEPLAARNLPAGGLISTVEDMSHFAIAMLGNGRYGEQEILSSDSMAEMFRIQNAKIPLDLSVRWGLGWSYDHHKLGGFYDVVGHSGSSLAHTSNLSLVPELGIGVIVVCNNLDDYGAKERITESALEQLFSTRNIQHQPQQIATEQPEIHSNEIPVADYACEQGIISITRKNDKLHAIGLDRKQPYYLIEANDKWYHPSIRPRPGGIPLPITFSLDIKVTSSTIDGRDLLISRDDNGLLKILGERIKPQPESDIWRSRMGNYKYVNREWNESYINVVSLRFSDGYYLLEIYHKKTLRLRRVLQPINDNELVELGIGRGLGNTYRYSESSGKPTLSSCGRILELQ